MSKDIKINGVNYNEVKSVSVPLSAGGGNALFLETSDATANANDVAVGTTAYSKGAKVVGTLDISGKADKVSGATNNNLAALDSNGNLKDSGSTAGDFEAAGAGASAVGAHNSDTGAHANLNIMSMLAVRYDLQGAAADLNDITDGAFFIGSNNLNAAQLLDVIGGNNAYIAQTFQSAVEAGINYNRIQIAYSYTTNKVAMRRLYQSTWSSWVPIITGEGGTLEGDLNVPVLRVTSDTDASPTSDRHGFQVGSTDKANIAVDGNEIIARNNGAASILYLNADGGDVRVNGKSVYKEDDTIPIKDGGTGATTAATARNNIGEAVNTTSSGAVGDNYTKVATITTPSSDLSASAMLLFTTRTLRKGSGILHIGAYNSGGLTATDFAWLARSIEIEAYLHRVSSTEHDIYIKQKEIRQAARVSFIGPLWSTGAADIVLHNDTGIIASLPAGTVRQATDMAVEVMTAMSTDEIKAFRAAIGLGSTDGAVPIANGGTGGTTAAAARTNLGLANSSTGRSNLGFRTYNGNCTVAANAFYGDVTVSGATTSSLVFVNLRDARVNTTGIYPVHGYVTANNNVRVYFSNSTSSARTYPVHVLVVG